MGEGSQRRFVLVGAVALALALAVPTALASTNWWNGTYYTTLSSSASGYTLAPGQTFTQSVHWGQTYTGYSTLSGYWCCYSGRIWAAGPYQQSAGGASTISMSVVAPNTPGNHELYAFVVAAYSAYPTPTYYNGYTHFTITVVGDPSAPSLTETTCPNGWTTCNDPLWQWGGVSVPYGSVSLYQVHPSWTSDFTTTATSWGPIVGTGVHAIQVRARNNVGVWGPWSAAVFVSTDVTPPNAPTIASATAGAWSNHAQPTVTWTDPGDAGSGVASYARTLDGASANLGNTLKDTPSLSEGLHTYALRAVDGVGLASAASNTLTFKIDTTPPKTTISTGDPHVVDARGTWVTSATPLTLAASDALSGVATTTRDGSPYTGAFTLAGSDGPHDVSFASTDVAGNVENTHVATFLLDDTPPATAIVTPARGTVTVNDIVVPLPATGGPVDPSKHDPIVAGKINVTMTANDAGVGVATVHYFVDGVEKAATGCAAGCVTRGARDGAYSLEWDTSNLTLGAHTLAVSAIDRLGNAATSVENVTVVSASGVGPLPSPGPLPNPGPIPPPLPGAPDVSPVVDVTIDPSGPRVTYRIGADVNGVFYGVQGSVPPGG
ncbi:MAG: hypothetical protein ACYDCK_05800 [Thermoplasmatota archaeon]